MSAQLTWTEGLITWKEQREADNLASAGFSLSLFEKLRKEMRYSSQASRDCQLESTETTDPSLLVTLKQETTLTLKTKKEIDAFEGFENYFFSGWDGFDAQPLREQDLEKARKLVSILPDEFQAPDAALGADGSICMEWMIRDNEIFIDINSDETVQTYAELGDEKIKEDFASFDLALSHIIYLFQKAK